MATGLASRVIFRLMEGALVQAGGAPGACCPSRQEAFAPGTGGLGHGSPASTPCGAL